MAFISIPDSLITVGKALTRTLFKTYIKDNLDDLNSRVGVVEAGTSKVVVFDTLVSSSTDLSGGSALNGMATFRAPYSFSLTDAKVSILTTGSLTGSVEFDILKGSDFGFASGVSVFTTKPSINLATASDYDESSNAVFDVTNKDLIEGDYLRLDFTSLPTGDTFHQFHIYLIGEAS